jgi:uncharacterized membrane protein
MRAFWAASFVSGVVYNSIVFVSSCTSSVASGVLQLIGVPTIVTAVAKPMFETSVATMALGTSLVAGGLTGVLVYTVGKIRSERGEPQKTLEDLPHFQA